MIGSAFRRPFQGLRDLVARLSSDRGGNVVMMFAFAMPVLIMITFAGIDISRVTTVKARMQDALDAATLAAARSTYTDADALKQVALVSLRANLRDAAIEPFTDEDFTIALTDEQVVIADLRVQVKTLVANIVLPPYGKILDDTLPLGAHSEVNRSSKDIEVALVLDVTGSMRGTRIASLKDAARQLVDIVVQDQQSPYYSRMAIIPYSSGVNLNAKDIGFGDYRDAARGAPPPARNISGASWSIGSSKTITEISRANPGVVTANNHGFQTGDYVWISDIDQSGSNPRMNRLNDTAYRVTRINANSFSLQTPSGANVNTSSNARWSSGGKVIKCQVSDCSIVITANGHGLSTTDAATGYPGTVYISGVGGMTKINNKGFEIANVTPNTFSIGVNGAGYGSYTSGGKAYCGGDGCAYRVYRNVSGALLYYPLSQCVTERAGSEAYKDTSASRAHVGRLYPSGSGDDMCTNSPILPLTEDRDAMYGLIGVSSNVGSGLQPGGFTAGQIGLAWGWYAVSPDFAGFWPNTPAPYNPRKTLKAIILMTDGEFNMANCSGVMARNADTNSSTRIACDAPNGKAFAQAVQLCNAIKEAGDGPTAAVTIYTVGFSVSSNRGGPGIDTARELLENCASSTSQAFFPANGADLSESFKAIGRDITRLRISR